MKIASLLLLLCFNQQLFSQGIVFPKHLTKTQIAQLKHHDSLVYYQCHVDEATQELTTQKGQKITSKKNKLTITEKFVIHKIDSVYTCLYFKSSINNYPNKKFPYLTLKEVENWHFELQKQKQLSRQELLLTAAFETKTHPITHYELNINSTCPNELIICSKQHKEQVLVEGKYLLHDILNYW